MTKTEMILYVLVACVSMKLAYILGARSVEVGSEINYAAKQHLINMRITELQSNK